MQWIILDQEQPEAKRPASFKKAHCIAFIFGKPLENSGKTLDTHFFMRKP